MYCSTFRRYFDSYFSSNFLSLHFFDLLNVIRVPAVVRAGHRIGLKCVLFALHKFASLVQLSELFQPFKVQDLLKGRSLQTVFVEHGSARLLASFTHRVPRTETEVRIILNRLPRNFSFIFVVEREYPTKHKIRDNSK